MTLFTAPHASATFFEWQNASMVRVLCWSFGTLLLKEGITAVAVTATRLYSPKFSAAVLSRPVLRRCFEPYLGIKATLRTVCRRIVFRYGISAAVAFAFFTVQKLRGKADGTLSTIVNVDAVKGTPIFGPHPSGRQGYDIFPSWLHLLAWNEALYPSLYSVFALRLTIDDIPLHFVMAERICAVISETIQELASIATWRWEDRRRAVQLPLFYELLGFIGKTAPSALMKLQHNPPSLVLGPLVKLLSPNDRLLITLVKQELTTIGLQNLFAEVVGPKILDALYPAPPQTEDHNADVAEQTMQIGTTVGCLRMSEKERLLQLFEAIRLNPQWAQSIRLSAIHIMILMLLWNEHKGNLSSHKLLEMSGVKYQPTNSDDSADDCVVCLQPLSPLLDSRSPVSPNAGFATVDSSGGGSGAEDPPGDDSDSTEDRGTFPVPSAINGSHEDMTTGGPTGPAKRGPTVKVSPCNHEFHLDCLVKWIFESFTCPTCRADLDRRPGSPNHSIFADAPEERVEAAQQLLWRRMHSFATEMETDLPVHLNQRPEWVVVHFVSRRYYFRFLPQLLVGAFTPYPRQPLDRYLYPLCIRLLDM